MHCLTVNIFKFVLGNMNRNNAKYANLRFVAVLEHIRADPASPTKVLEGGFVLFFPDQASTSCMF